MKVKYNKYAAAGFLFLMCALLFLGFTMPFRLRLEAAQITEMRPSAALTPVLGMIFGAPASLGCAAGNIIADLISGYEVSYALLSGAQQLLYGMLAFVLWRRLHKEHDGSEFCLDSISRLLKLFLVMASVAVVSVFCTAIINHAYNVADIITINSLYMFFNVFDSGLIFGCPLMILGHFLQRKMNNMREEKHDKIVVFSLNERMIINSLVTGLGICLLIGAAVYLADKLSIESSSVGLWGQIYLFQTLALNFYFALSMGFMWFTEKKISRPVENLARVAHSYYGEHSGEEDRQKLLEACQEYSGDNTEVGDLARSYISMVEDIGGYVTNLQKVTAEKERINAELSLASSIQAHMLPCIFPAFPERDEFDIYASMTPAKEVGGDFYDFFMVDDSHMAVVMADVSGKGVPAALFMVIAKTLIKNYAQSGIKPEEVFTTVNRLLCDGNDAGLFVTAWLGVLELSTGKLTFVNAGHNPPMIKQNGGEFTYLKYRAGFVLAGMETIKYRQNEITIAPGDRIFLYTDGVTEATNSQNQLYGEERLSAFMNSHTGENAEEILHDLKTDIYAFQGEAPQFDDITMLMLDYKKKMEV
ncbi:MAG: PP2C family protein-serine/threonine phosphatase [Oscillospiraceae bacterium]|nr:PP2C family protein-serine/threonine phosphatase [Oscillospiraceae bacterium]